MPFAHPNCSHPIRRRLRTALLFFGAVLFLFEEVLWVGCLRVFKWLGRFGLLRWVDARLARLPSMLALTVLLIPVVLLFPVKIAGLWMIGSGRFMMGCCTMLLAKILSTAIVARIFLATRPQLLRMPWFARLYNVACALRDRVHDWLARQPAWRDAKRFMKRLRTMIRPASAAMVRAGVLRRWRRGRRRHAMAAQEARHAGWNERR
jgi:hypothetical protein